MHEYQLFESAMSHGNGSTTYVKEIALGNVEKAVKSEYMAKEKEVSVPGPESSANKHKVVHRFHMNPFVSI